MTPEQAEIYSKMNPVRKLELAASFILSARKLKAAALRSRHPEWSDVQIQQHVKEVFLFATD